VNLLVDRNYENYFQSCKCSGSITENRRWSNVYVKPGLQVKRFTSLTYKSNVLQVWLVHQTFYKFD